MITQWGAPNLDATVVAQLDTLLAECQSATATRLLQASTIVYQERVLAAFSARVQALEDFIRAQGLQVPPEGSEPATAATAAPPSGQY